MSADLVHFPPVPRWVIQWREGDDTGVSSRTIACVMIGWPISDIMIGWRGDAPYDTSDVGRCVRLLDLAAEHGEDWRARLHEVAARVSAWAPLVPRWADIEAAYREDVVAQEAWSAAGHDRRTRSGRPRKNGVPIPPSRCWHLVSVLRGHGDPYKGREVSWGREPVDGRHAD